MSYLVNKCEFIPASSTMSEKIYHLAPYLLTQKSPKPAQPQLPLMSCNKNHIQAFEKVALNIKNTAKLSETDKNVCQR